MAKQTIGLRQGGTVQNVQIKHTKAQEMYFYAELHHESLRRSAKIFLFKPKDWGDGLEEQVQSVYQGLRDIALCFKPSEWVYQYLTNEQPWENMMSIMYQHVFVMGYQNTKVDFFLQYQANIKEGQDRKYLEYPGSHNEAAGISITPAYPASTEYRDGQNGLQYHYNGQWHPISRPQQWLTWKVSKAVNEGDMPPPRRTQQTPPAQSQMPPSPQLATYSTPPPAQPAHNTMPLTPQQAYNAPPPTPMPTQQYAPPAKAPTPPVQQYAPQPAQPPTPAPPAAQQPPTPQPMSPPVQGAPPVPSQAQGIPMPPTQPTEESEDLPF